MDLCSRLGKLIMDYSHLDDSETRQERRGARSRGKRRAARFHGKEQVFTASDHLRFDWTPEEVAGRLEVLARGYKSIMQETLCTAAAMLRDAVSEDLLAEKDK